MTLSTQPYKGARDFYPEDKRLQKYMFGVMRKVVEKFGYEEYDAPILEPSELFASKTSDEIVKEQTYTFTDRGDRSVTIRTEMTPTVSRMVAAKRQELAFPVRWYSIPNLWRYERPQRGRLREFWQLNVDLFGVSVLSAEHEMMLIADEIMKTYGAKREMYTFKINSRKLVNSVMSDVLGAEDTQTESLIRLIDRMQKIEQAEFIGQADGIFTPSQREAGASEKLFEILKIKTISELPDTLKLHESVQDMKNLIALLKESGIENVEFDITLMRGFDYYTDIVFEVFDNHPENNRSMFGGGRYDGLVSLFGVEPLPAIGFAMGDVPLQNFLESHGLLPSFKHEVDLYVILIGDIYEQVHRVVQHFREMGLKVIVDMTGRKADKQLKTALKKDIHYVLFVGENELADEQYMLKNLSTGKEERHGAERIVSIVKDYRQK